MCACHGLRIATYGTGAGKDSERSEQTAQGRVGTSDRWPAGSLHSCQPLGHGCAGRGAEANQGLATDWGTMRIQARNHIREAPCKSVASYLRFLLAPSRGNTPASAAHSRSFVIAVSDLSQMAAAQSPAWPRPILSFQRQRPGRGESLDEWPSAFPRP